VQIDHVTDLVEQYISVNFNLKKKEENRTKSRDISLEENSKIKNRKKSRKKFSLTFCIFRDRNNKKNGTILIIFSQ